jgi:hypothetical protein
MNRLRGGGGRPAPGLSSLGPRGPGSLPNPDVKRVGDNVVAVLEIVGDARGPNTTAVSAVNESVSHGVAFAPAAPVNDGLLEMIEKAMVHHNSTPVSQDAKMVGVGDFIACKKALFYFQVVQIPAIPPNGIDTMDGTGLGMLHHGMPSIFNPWMVT